MRERYEPSAVPESRIFKPGLRRSRGGRIMRPDNASMRT